MADNNNSIDLWQYELENPLVRLLNLRERNLFTDCKFEVEGKNFDAHKIVLAMSSPVFEKMFFGSFPHDNNENPISIDDLDAATFEFILKYIYENYTEIGSLEEASKVLYVARKYMINALEKICISYLEKIADYKNVFEVHELASKYDIQQLKDSCVKIIKLQTIEVLRNSDFKRIGIDNFLFVLKQPEVNCPEFLLFSAIEKYVRENNIQVGDDGISARCTSTPQHKKLKTESNVDGKDSHNEEIPEIFEAIKSIRFLCMGPYGFAKGPALSKLLSKDEKLSILVNINTKTTTLPLPAGFSTTRLNRMLPKKDPLPSAAQ